MGIIYIIEELKCKILILQWRGISNDLKAGTPTFKYSLIYMAESDLDPSTLFWIVLMFSITFGYVGASTLPIGLVLLSIVYIISWGYLLKWMYPNLELMKGIIDSSDKLHGKELIFGISVTAILLSILYGGLPLTPANNGIIWGIVAFVWLIIIVVIGFGFLPNIAGFKDKFPNISFYGLLLIFLGIIVWNFTNLTMVTNAVVKRTKLTKSYDVGDVSKRTKTNITTFEALFYTSTFSLITLACLVVLPDNRGKKDIATVEPLKPYYLWSSVVLFLTALSTSVGNYFVSNDLILKLPSETVKVTKKTDTDTSTEKIQNQNIFSSAYYSVLRFFNDPSII